MRKTIMFSLLLLCGLFLITPPSLLTGNERPAILGSRGGC